MTVEDLLEDEELIWQGRPVRAPWDYWGVLLAFAALFGALLAAPLAWFLVSGEVMLEITLNGAPLTPDTPREQAAAALWGMGVMLAVGVAMMILLTAHRLSQRYIVTSQRVIAGSTFPFTRSQELALARVLALETAGRGRLRTTHLRYAPSATLIGRIIGLGQISFHDYADPHGRLAARLSALIHPSSAADPDAG